VSRFVNGVFLIEEEPDGQCEFCGKWEELRPYGPNNERICFTCGMKDEETTGRKFLEMLDG
jgi:hypothetical protein